MLLQDLGSHVAETDSSAPCNNPEKSSHEPLCCHQTAATQGNRSALLRPAGTPPSIIIWTGSPQVRWHLHGQPGRYLPALLQHSAALNKCVLDNSSSWHGETPLQRRPLVVSSPSNGSHLNLRRTTWQEGRLSPRRKNFAGVLFGFIDAIITRAASESKNGFRVGGGN